MKYFVVFAVCVAVASAASVRPWQTASAVAKSVVSPVAPVVKQEAPVVRSQVNSEVDATVLRFDSDVKPDGFNYVYETANGISGEASGVLKKVADTEAVAHQGSYRYVSPDGTPVAVSYVADENGYQPQSDLLPVPPPVPVAILRALEWIAAHPQPESVVAKRV